MFRALGCTRKQWQASLPNNVLRVRVLAYKKTALVGGRRRLDCPPGYIRDVYNIPHTNLDASAEMHGLNSSSSNAAPRAARAFKSTRSRHGPAAAEPSRRHKKSIEARKPRRNAANATKEILVNEQELLRHTHHRSRRAPTRATPWTRTSPYQEAATPPKQSSPRPSPHHRCRKRNFSFGENAERPPWSPP